MALLAHPPKSAIIPAPKSIIGDVPKMALKLESGKTVRVTISKTINRASARKTLERLFMRDKAVSGPINVRSRNFIELPKRRGGQIWTKRPNKVHPSLDKGVSAKVRVTPQSIKDLNSVETFVQVG
jgi:hypothetical protein